MPQHETVALDAYILDTLLRDLVGHDRHPSAFMVYLFLWRETHGRRQPAAQLALIDIAEGVGLSKRGVQGALGQLAKRKFDRGGTAEHHGRAGLHRAPAVATMNYCGI